MIKVLLVDDEILIRTHIKMLLDWNHEGFSVCGEASNGKQAIKVIELTQPHIVLLDIKMPIMDGYELCKHIHTHHKSIKMIVLSNYDDFDYVKGTLQLGAIDYLLKHNLNRDTLLSALNLASDMLADSQSLKSNTSLRSLNNISTLREKFIVQLLSGFYTQQAEIEGQLELLDINLGFRNILPIAMEVDYKEAHSPSACNLLPNNALLDYSIVNIINELLLEHKNGIVTHVDKRQFALLLSFSTSISESQKLYITNNLLTTLSSCLKKFLDISVSFSIGNICPNFSHIPQEYEKAALALRNKFYVGKNSIIDSRTKLNLLEDLTGLPVDTEKQLINTIKNNDTDLLLDILTSLFTSIKTTNLSINGTKMIFYDLLNIIIKTTKDNSIEYTSLFPNEVTPHEILANLETIDDAQHWILSLFQTLMSLCYVDDIPCQSEYVTKAITFIKQNYTHNISLTDTAEAIGIGSAYLSRLFKEEMGIGFAEYLGNIRLERAKQLLSQGDYKLKDAAHKSGFNDYSYFTKFFKKKVGVSPKQYK